MESNYLTVNQTAPIDTVSGKYTFLPTSKVVEDFGKLGWRIRNVQEARVNKKKNMGFQKHVVRMNHPDFMDMRSVNGNVPEIVVINSHDGKSSYKIMLGIFRLVCSNGLVLSENMFANHRIIHKGYCAESVRTITEDVINSIPKVEKCLGEYSEIKLDREEQMIMASAASGLRWNPEEQVCRPESLLRVRRSTDRNNDLFTMYNVIQENIIKGGMRITKKDENGYKVSERRAKRVTSINEDVRLNKALWEITTKMAELKR